MGHRSMITDTELRQDLQFLSGQKSWVYKEVAGQDKAEVLTPSVIAKESGVYWVAGETTLHGGRKLESVFRVDTNAGGSLVSVFWKIADQWYRHDEPDALEKLDLPKDEVFPFDWSLAVPLEEDIFHS
ncbi:hypothetical protein [Thalassoglobus neptunius]|nr:hypothetical protein [Thalassoglobus neptunius]